MNNDSNISTSSLTQNIDNSIRLLDINMNKFAPLVREKTCYKDINEYFSSIGQFIKDEFDEENIISSKMIQRNTTIKWDFTSNPKMIRFTYKHKRLAHDEEISIDIGDSITLRRNRISLHFHIYSTPDISNDEYGAECKIEYAKDLHLLTNFSYGFIIDYSRSNHVFQKRLEALCKFITHETSGSISNYLVSKILGHSTEDSFTSYDKYFTSVQAPNLPSLDPSQEAALRESITNSLHLINGPPGSGKTITLAAIIFNLVKLRNYSKVLVCAASNIAVDNLAKIINSTGLNVIRIYSLRQESYKSVVKEISLNAKVEELIKFSETNSLDYIKILPQIKISYKDLRKPHIWKMIKSTLVDKAQVICCTCIGLANKVLESRKFDVIIFDESTQVTEADCLVALTNGCNHLIMVGDHCQLGPTIIRSSSSKNQLPLSLFERLYYNNNSCSQLSTQYRMHPFISKFPSYTFYSNQITDFYTPLTLNNKISSEKYFNWPNPNKPVIFFAHNYPEDPLKSFNYSHSNKYEAEKLVEILIRLINTGFTYTQIGVITYHEHQIKIIQNMLRNKNTISEQNIIDLETATFYSFQGREKDIIILSCVRSNYSDVDIGLLSDPRVLNVSLTRAKHGLIILGNIKCLRKIKIWEKLIEYYLENDLIFSCSFDELKKYKYPEE